MAHLFQLSNPFKLDLRSIAAYRIGLALLLIADLVNRSSFLRAHYTDFGLLPRGPLIEKFSNISYFSVYFFNGSWEWVVALFSINVFCAICLLFGYRTKWMIVICWILNVSLQNRNTMVLQGGDVLFRVLLFWTMFLPLGARYSIDKALSYKDGFKDYRIFKENRFLSMGTVAIVIQIFLVYVSTAVLKSGNEYIPEGTATYYALMLDHFVTPLGLWLRQFYETLRYLTYAVLGWEYIGAFLLIAPFASLRLFAALGFIVMHLSFSLTMELGLFPYIDCVSMLLFFPASVWSYINSRIKKPQIKIFYDQDCGVCKKLVFILKEFWLLQDEQLSPAQSDKKIQKSMSENNSWVIQKNDQLFFKGEGFITCLRELSWVFFPFKIWQLPPLKKLIVSLYPVLANRRDKLSRFTKSFLPERTYTFGNNKLLSTIILFLLLLVTAWNLNSSKLVPQFFPDSFKPLMYTLRLDQYWNMFAPYPMKDDGWFVFEALLSDNSTMNTFDFTPGPVSFEKPELVSQTYPNQRWRKYLMNIWKKKHAQKRLYFGKYLCRRWNNYPENQGKLILTHKIYYIKEVTRLNYEVDPPDKVLLWSHDCFKKSS